MAGSGKGKENWLDRAIADGHEKPGERRHGDVLDRTSEQQDDDGHDCACDEKSDPALGARRLDQRRCRHRTADRHPLEDADSHVGRTLTDEVS